MLYRNTSYFFVCEVYKYYPESTTTTIFICQNGRKQKGQLPIKAGPLISQNKTLVTTGVSQIVI